MFSKHKSIERFTGVFLVLCICMGMCVGSIVYKKSRFDAETLSNQAIYTTEVTTSRSQVEGSVVSVLSNKEQTKAFVLLKMESMENLSTNADDYKLFVAGSNSGGTYSDIKSQPSGGIYVFGSTGYIGFYLVNYQKFDNQIISVIVRNTKDYTSTGTDINSDEVTINNSFEKFDQMQVFFNPGAKGVETANFLESDKIDVEDMYREIVAVPESETLKETLNNDLKSMFNTKVKIDNYTKRLTDGSSGAKVQIPDVPDSIADDDITASTYDGELLKWSGSNWTDKHGDTVDKDYYLKLDTDYVFQGGYNFEWQTIDFNKKADWLKDIIGSVSLDDYLSKQTQAVQNSKDSSGLDMDDITWYLDDGSVLTLDTESSDSTVKSLSTDISKLQEFWSQYYDTKYQYEVEDLKAIVYLQRDVQNMTSMYTENFSDSAVTIY